MLIENTYIIKSDLISGDSIPYRHVLSEEEATNWYIQCSGRWVHFTMDPSAYARHRGIQSEANKVTVTRVAGGEIEYRRVVDTFR